MKLDLFDINEFIKLNHCQEVTSPIFFQYDGNPTPNGLFSYDIFGMSDEERKNRFGYIDLHGKFIHPLVFSLIVGRMGALGDVLLGKKYAVIANKKVTIVPSSHVGAETGLRFIYDHFEEIDWINELEEREVDSIDKKTRLKFLKKLSINEFFIDKWLVLPPFYRDQSSTNRSMGDDINKLYKELISKTKSLNTGFSFELFGDETKLRIQMLLRDLYNSTLTPVSGKHVMLDKNSTRTTLAGSGKGSMLRKHLLGKTIDWTASCVITSPQNNNARKITDKPVPFGYGAFPLATLLSLFEPFFLAETTQYLEEFLTNFANDFSTTIKRINVSQFNTAEVERLIKSFIKSPKERFNPIEFKFINIGGKEEVYGIPIYEYKTEADAKANKNAIKRPMTLADLFYIIAVGDILKDKHVYVTRYPIANFQNIYPAKIKVLSTARPKEVYIKVMDPESDSYTYYGEYPTDPSTAKSRLDSEFIDVMICGNIYLASLGGDYDRRYVIS